jgi:hypothetical protein
VLSFGTAGVATLTNAVTYGDLLYFLLDDLENVLIYQSLTKDTTSNSISRIDGNAGKIDLSYGKNGEFQLPEGNQFGPGGIEVGNGSLLISGQYSDSGPVRSVGYGILRVTNSGALDTQFGSNGMARQPTNVEDAPLSSVGTWYGTKTLADGKILAFGLYRLESLLSPSNKGVWDEALTVTRFLPNGQIDTGFGNAGTTSINVSGNQKNRPEHIRLFVTDNHFVLMKWNEPDFNFGANTLEQPVMVTLSKNGVIEKVSRALYDPLQTDLKVTNLRDTSRVMDVQALPDGSLFTVGPVCKLVPGSECQLNVGFARFSP